MKTSFLFILTFLAFTAFGQSRTVSVRDSGFIIKVILLDNENGDPIKQVELYRDNSKMLTHTISKSESDCNSESIELGTFETTDKTVVLYSYWTKAGDAPVSPNGVRKQIYSVDKNGKLNLTKAELYIETWTENAGMDYLFSTPRDDDEKRQLKEYITAVEQAYNGTFIFGTARSSLLTEVRVKLRRQIQAATKD